MGNNTSLTTMATTFITVTLIFSVFLYNYVQAGVNGYDVSDFDNGNIQELANEQKANDYIEDVEASTEALQPDNSLADIIGNLISIAIAPVRLIISGINYMITGIGNMINILLPGNGLFSAYLTGVLTLIISSILLFAIVLGRRDKID